MTRSYEIKLVSIHSQTGYIFENFFWININYLKKNFEKKASFLNKKMPKHSYKLRQRFQQTDLPNPNDSDLEQSSDDEFVEAVSSDSSDECDQDFE